MSEARSITYESACLIGALPLPLWRTIANLQVGRRWFHHTCRREGRWSQKANRRVRSSVLVVILPGCTKRPVFVQVSEQLDVEQITLQLSMKAESVRARLIEALAAQLIRPPHHLFTDSCDQALNPPEADGSCTVEVVDDFMVASARLDLQRHHGAT